MIPWDVRKEFSMADYDALDHGVPWKWKKAFTLVQRGAAFPEVVSSVAKALTATLRYEGGLPCFDSLTTIAEDVATGRESGGDALAQIKRIEHAAWDIGHIRDAAHIAKQLIIEIAQGDIPSVSYCEEISKRFCMELIEQKCFARARSKLIGETWSSYAEYMIWHAEVREAMQDDLRKIVQQLIQDPSGKSIRAPRHPRPKRIPTEVLLDMPLDE
jgi:hypothetical protein